MKKLLLVLTVTFFSSAFADPGASPDCDVTQPDLPAKDASGKQLNPDQKSVYKLQYWVKVKRAGSSRIDMVRVATDDKLSSKQVLAKFKEKGALPTQGATFEAKDIVGPEPFKNYRDQYDAQMQICLRQMRKDGKTSYDPGVTGCDTYECAKERSGESKVTFKDGAWQTGALVKIPYGPNGEPNESAQTCMQDPVCAAQVKAAQGGGTKR